MGPGKKQGYAFQMWDRLTQAIGYIFIADNPLVLGRFNTPINEHGKQMSLGVDPWDCTVVQNLAMVTLFTTTIAQIDRHRSTAYECDV